MTNKDLVDYIKTQTGKGVPLDVIKTNLRVGGGWNDDDINQAIQESGVGASGAGTGAVIEASRPAADPKTENQNISVGESALQAHPPKDFRNFREGGENSFFQMDAEKDKQLRNKAVMFAGIFAAAGLIFAVVLYFLSPGFFVKDAYTEENFLSKIIAKSSKIESSSYKVSLAMNVSPRDADAYPMVPKELSPEIKKAYKNDSIRARDVSQILTQLGYQDKYPSNLRSLKSVPGLYGQISLTDPVSGGEYGYRLTEGGNNFALSVNFETKDAISLIKGGWNYNSESTPIEGQTVVFTKDSSPFIHFPAEPPKPFWVGLSEATASLPSEISANISFNATANWNTADTEFDFDANVDFGDLIYKVNAEYITKDGKFYFKINNIPSMFLGPLSSIKDRWVMVDLKKSSDALGALGGVSNFFEEFSEYEKSMKEDRETIVRLIKRSAELADKEGVIEFRNKPVSEKIGEQKLKRYDLRFRKDAIIPFYEKLLDELKKDEYKNHGDIFADSAFLDYLKSENFEEAFDYYDKNTFLSLWVDRDGFPVVLEHRIRVIPPDNATQLKDKQINIVMRSTISEINKKVDIKAPADFISLDELIKDSPWNSL